MTDSNPASTGTLRCFPSLPLTWMIATVVGGADVADVGVTEFVCAEAAQQCGKDDREISFRPISVTLRSAVSPDSFQQRFDCGAGEGFGERPR
jgi:hypothetical protein